VLPKFVPGEVAFAPALDADTPHAVAGHERAGRALPAGAIDGSCLLVLGPYGPFSEDDALVAGTLAAVERTLVVDGGVHRYLEDEYYGGGLWVVLAGALAQVLAPNEPDLAERVLAWIEAQADEDGALPEQVETHLRRPASRAAWVERWGSPARPLLWSHAMYLLGLEALRGATR
jgi:GH15 family glucan-1,4-alpha-glucosidase